MFQVQEDQEKGNKGKKKWKKWKKTWRKKAEFISQNEYLNLVQQIRNAPKNMSDEQVLNQVKHEYGTPRIPTEVNTTMSTLIFLGKLLLLVGIVFSVSFTWMSFFAF